MQCPEDKAFSLPQGSASSIGRLKLARGPRSLAAIPRGFTFYLESRDSRFALAKGDVNRRALVV
jgi:hypothetical protein